MPDATRVRRVASRPAGPPQPRPTTTPAAAAVCRCKPRPVPVVTFRRRHPQADADIITEERRHWRVHGCELNPPVRVDDDLAKRGR